MQKTVILAVLLSISAASICGQNNAGRDKQSLPTNDAVENNQEALAIGAVELRLGMPQDVALGKLTRAGYDLKKNNLAPKIGRPARETCPCEQDGPTAPSLLNRLIEIHDSRSIAAKT